LHNRDHRTSRTAGVAEREERARAGGQRRSSREVQPRDTTAAAEQRGCYMAAELHSDVSSVDDRDKDEPHATPPVDANTAAQGETADDRSRHPDADADPNPEAKSDAAAVLWSRRQ
jgi:hypothetical protein